MHRHLRSLTTVVLSAALVLALAGCGVTKRAGIRPDDSPTAIGTHATAAADEGALA